MKWKKLLLIFEKKTTLTLVACIFLSAILWILTKLSNVYTEQIKVQVGYTDIPANLFLEKSFRNDIKVKVEGTGFALLRYHFDKQSLFLAMDKLKHLEGDTYEFPKNISFLLNEEELSKFKIRNILTDEVHIPLQKKLTKKIPVIYHSNVSFRVEYQLTDLIVNPDSITVSGYKNVIDTLTALHLQGQKRKNVDDSFEQVFPLENSQGIRYQDSLVRVQAIVSKMSEKVIQVPIMIKNVPQGLDLKLFPSEVELVCAGIIDLLKTVKPSDFQVVADYSKREEDQTHIPLKIVRKPEGIKAYLLDDKKVEYLIKKR